MAYNWDLKKDIELLKRWDKYVVKKLAKDFGTTCDVIRERIRLYRFRDYEEYPEYMFICIAFYLYGYNDDNVMLLAYYLNMLPQRVRGMYNYSKKYKTIQTIKIATENIKKINH